MPYTKSNFLENNEEPIINDYPALTGNEVVADPRIRKFMGTVLAWSTLLLSIATLVDSAIPAIDYAFITGPAAIITGGLLSIFQVGVTNKNYPSTK